MKSNILSLLFYLLFLIPIAVFGDQIDIDRIESMPNLPEPYLMRDWEAVTRDYTELVFDFDAAGEYLPLIWWNNNPLNYPEHNSFGLHTMVGTAYPTSSEGINLLPAVISASLAGYDMTSWNGYSWVLACEEYFNNRPAENVYLNHPSASSGQDWWYDTMPNIFFYQLQALYPDVGHFSDQLPTVSRRWLEAVQTMGGGTTPWTVPEMYYRGWYLETMTPNDSGVAEPEAAGAIAWLLYNAWLTTGQTDFRIGAEQAMEYLNGLTANPSYELQLSYGAQTAARMNAELHTGYNLDKMLNWCFDVGPLRNWGAINQSWGGLDCHGLIGQVYGGGYAFAMNTFEQIGALVPVARYNDQYARAIGKWVLNAANASRLFYSAFLPDQNQDNENWSQMYDPESVVSYEGLRQLLWSESPYATGDAMGAGWAETNLALYGASHVGSLGGIIRTTNETGILQLNLTVTDYYKPPGTFPTYIVYNPHENARTVTLLTGSDPVDIYELTNNEFLAYSVVDSVEIAVPSDEARIVALLPAGAVPMTQFGQLLVDGIPVDYSASTPADNYPPRIKSFAAADTLVEISGETQLFCTAADPDGDDLTVQFQAAGGEIDQTGNPVTWQAPEEEGDYVISCTISDPSGLQDSTALTVTVIHEINLAPVILGLSAVPRKLDLENSASCLITAEDPENDYLDISWSAPSGTFSESDTAVVWTAPATAGNYTLTCHVSDGNGNTAADSIQVMVRDFSLAQSGSMVLHYPFSGNAQDYSGNNLDGQVSGAVLTEDVLGQPLNAYRFDGVNDRIQCSSDPELNFTGGISVSCWLNADQFFEREAYPISHGNWENRWKISVTNDRIRWTIRTDHYQNNGITDLDSERMLSESTWFHLVTVYDGSDLEIWLNGELDAFGSWQGSLLTTAWDLTVGQALPGNSQYNFDGIIDDVRIFDYGLGVAEIQGLYQTQSCSESGDMTCDYELDIMDVMVMVSILLSEVTPMDYQFINADLNQDGTADILDIVILVYLILN